jgi:hypothetical protein
MRDALERGQIFVAWPGAMRFIDDRPSSVTALGCGGSPSPRPGGKGGQVGNGGGGTGGSGVSGFDVEEEVGREHRRGSRDGHGDDLIGFLGGEIAEMEIEAEVKMEVLEGLDRLDIRARVRD